MLNNICLSGRMVADPELKKTMSGADVCTFTIAVDRNYKNKDGAYDTDFIDIIAINSTAVFVSKYFKKAQIICLYGELQVNKYTDNDGKKRTQYRVFARQAYFGGSKAAEPPVEEAVKQVLETAELNSDGLPF